jgi:hypothetical protein
MWHEEGSRRRREPHSGVFLGKKQRFTSFYGHQCRSMLPSPWEWSNASDPPAGGPDTLARRRLGGRATRRARALYLVNHIEMLLVVLIVFVASFMARGIGMR